MYVVIHLLFENVFLNKGKFRMFEFDLFFMKKITSISPEK